MEGEFKGEKVPRADLMKKVEEKRGRNPVKEPRQGNPFSSDSRAHIGQGHAVGAEVCHEVAQQRALARPHALCLHGRGV